MRIADFRFFFFNPHSAIDNSRFRDPAPRIFGLCSKSTDSSSSSQRESEICQEILFGRASLKSPPCPPFDKGRAGGIWEGHGPRENPGCWVRLCQYTNDFSKVIDHALFEQSSFGHFPFFKGWVKPADNKTDSLCNRMKCKGFLKSISRLKFPESCYRSIRYNICTCFYGCPPFANPRKGKKSPVFFRLGYNPMKGMAAKFS